MQYRLSLPGASEPHCGCLQVHEFIHTIHYNEQTEKFAGYVSLSESQ